MASPAAVLQVFVNANTKVASAQLAAFDRQLSGVGKTSAATGASMGKMTKGAAMAGAGIAAVGAAAIVAGKQLYDLGVQFDEAYDTIRVRTGATGRELRSLENSFKGVAANVPNDFKEVGLAVADLNTRLGLTGKPLERMAENVLHLSELTGDDLESNIKAVARSFVDWEVAIPKQTRYLDAMFRVSQASGASIAELSEQVQRFGSPLRQLGFDFDEAVSMFASFERAGVNTQTMVPGLKLAISNLTRPTENLAAQMSKLGIEAGKPDVALRQIFKLLGSGSTLSQIEKTGLAMDVFGKRAGADMAEAIKQGRFELVRFLRIFRDDQGDSIRKAARDTYDFSENMRIFGNRLKVVVEPAATGVFKVLGRISKILASPFVARALKAMGRVFKATFDAIALAVRPMVRGVRGGFAVIRDVAKATAKVFRGIVGPIKNALSAVVGAVRDRFRKAQIAAVNFVNGIIKVINKIPGVEIGTISLGFGEGSSQRGRAAGLQRGGFLMGGKPSGDSIPAMLERGEYVLNREAVKKVGVQRLNKLNFQNAPRFQKGGRVGMIDGGAVSRLVDHLPGVNAVQGAATLFGKGASFFIDKLPKPDLPEPIKGLGPWVIDQVTEFIKKRVPKFLTGSTALGAARGQIRQAMALAISKGLRITSGFPLGTPGVHSPNSYHYQYGRAFDASNGVNTPQMRSYAIEAAARWGQNILELFYDPLGWYVKNGSRVSGAIGGHSDHVHTAMQRGGPVGFQKGGWVKTGYTVFDDPGGGYLGHLQQGKGYAELGTATQGGVATNRGYIAQALGMSGELRDKFPLDVMINGKKRKMFKRDRGYGQGTPAYSIDIYRDSWPFFGLNQFSKGTAMIRKSASQKEIRRVKRAAQRVIDRIKEARSKGGLRGFLDAARKNAGKAIGLADDGEIDRARTRLNKARRQIRKAMKGRKPSGGGSGPGGGAAPGSIDPTLPGMPTGNTLEDLRRAVAFLQEDADLFDEQAGLEWSPAGSELDPTERATLISKNQALLAKLVQLRDKLVATINYWRDRVPKLRDKVKKAREAIKDLRKKIKGSKDDKKIRGWQNQIRGHQNDIKGWDKGISKGTDLLGSLPDELDGIQGVTGRGGDIARVQLVLAELGRPAAVDPADGGGDSEIADLLRQQLQETQSALAISQAQMPIFQQFMPKFHQGGIVQGPTGAERPVMAQAGEGIFTRDQMRAMGSQNITVVIEDAAIDSNRIRVEVDGVIQDKVSTVRRQGSNRRFVTSR